MITADHIEGPWSDPVDLEAACAHRSRPRRRRGRQALPVPVSGGDRVAPQPTTDCRTDGAVEHVYDPWRYPDGLGRRDASRPKARRSLRHGDWFYLITAVGGTAGPPTGHMVIVARSRSIHGPVGECAPQPDRPHRDRREKWWSRGHATAGRGPDGSTGGWSITATRTATGRSAARRCSIPWTGPTTAGSWPTAATSRARCQAAQRRALAARHGAVGRLLQRQARRPSGLLRSRRRTNARALRREPGALRARGQGHATARLPRRCSFIAGDLVYEVEVEIEMRGEAQAGVLLFYNRRLYCGLGFDAQRFTMHHYGLERTRAKPAGAGRKLWLRVTQRPPHRHVPPQRATAGPGPSSTCRWKSPATTTTWPATS